MSSPNQSVEGVDRFIKLFPTEEGIETAGRMLREGKCVAFPTETVYGLGANALDEAAVHNIFAYKGRPLTDPLIVHVPDAAAAGELVTLPAEGRVLFDALAKAFWPGPLTIVALAKSCIPLSVTAGTGFVGVRVPLHETALALLRASKVPIAAPSANRFGHVSPTQAMHVVADLGRHPIGILFGEAADGDSGGGRKSASSSSSVLATGVIDRASSTPLSVTLHSVGTPPATTSTEPQSCAIGIESTVIKIEQVGEDNPASVVAGAASRPVSRVQIVLFRKGGVSHAQLLEALKSSGFEHVPIVTRTLHKPHPVNFASSKSSAVVSSSSSSSSSPAAEGTGGGGILVPEGAVKNVVPPASSSHLPLEQNSSASSSAGKDLTSEMGEASSLSSHQGGDGGRIEGGEQAPGLLLTHYAPDADTYLVSSLIFAAPSGGDSSNTLGISSSGSSSSSISSASPSLASALPSALPLPAPLDASGIIVLDFAGMLAPLSPIVKAYRDLSPSGNIIQVRSQIFEALRWAEAVPGAKMVLMADIASGPSGVGREHMEAVRDRLFRAASGRIVQLVLHGGELHLIVPSSA